MKLLLLALAVSVSLLTSRPLHAQAPAGCAPDAGLTFICGLQNPEDVVPVPGTPWLLTSGMAPGAGLSVVETQAKTVRKLYATGTANARADRTRFANCPGPLDAKLAVLHGLALRPASGGRYTLYATNHGGRESVEVFELSVGTVGATRILSATWIGCVLLPPKLAANSVAAFSDGTLVATVLILPGKTFQDAFAMRNTGIVLQWTPGTPRFVELKGTELVANNGIETSRRRSRVLRCVDDRSSCLCVFARQTRRRASAVRAAEGLWPG